ncbi:MAG: glucosaminidase domain-containing protein [Saprospiraceae bacterium]|nr:glucosaminidase domain-containing protein [Saprospiraceae bacterium]
MNSKTAASAFQPGLLGEPVLWKCLLLMAITYLVWSEKLSIVFDFNPSRSQYTAESGGQRVKASLFPGFSMPSSEEVERPRPQKAQVLLPANARNNLSFAIDPGFAQRYDVEPEIMRSALDKCQDYVERFGPVAVAEMHKFGIPASVILAQGLLESNAGDSGLARNANNHFGMKCFSNKCKAGHCVNATDDSHKDFFVKYSNVWSSYRAHSQLLKNNKRYARLFDLDNTDYRGWAHGLSKSGYATDRQYAEKLIALITNLRLTEYDRG